MNKKGFLVLLIAISAVFASSARRGGGGRGWHGGGRGWHGGGRRWHGGGWRGGYRRPYWGWGRGYYGGGWWGTPGFGLTIVSDGSSRSDRYYDDYADSRGKTYWRVFNDTPYNVRFTSEGYDARTISPGDSQKIPHENGFSFTITTDTGRQLSSSTSKHSIRIYDRGRGRIGIRKSN